MKTFLKETILFLDRFRKSNGKANVGIQQAHQHRLPRKMAKFTGHRILDTEPTDQDEGTPSSGRAPPKESVPFSIEVIPEVHVRNHGRLDVEKLSRGDTTK